MSFKIYYPDNSEILASSVIAGLSDNPAILNSFYSITGTSYTGTTGATGSTGNIGPTGTSSGGGNFIGMNAVNTAFEIDFAPQNIDNGWSVIYDTNNAFNNGFYTFPVAGKYLITCSFRFEYKLFTQNQNIELFFYLNEGVIINKSSTIIWNTVSTVPMISTSFVYQFNQNDVVIPAINCNELPMIITSDIYYNRYTISYLGN